MEENEYCRSKEKGKGWYEASDASGKAPMHRAVSTKKKLKDLFRLPMVKREVEDECKESEDIIEKKTTMLVVDEKGFEEIEDADDFKNLKNERGTDELDADSDKMDEK